MDSAKIIQLRRQLKLSSLQLSALIGAAHSEVLDWEAGRKFATRHHVESMRALERELDADTALKDAAAVVPPQPPPPTADALLQVMQKLTDNPRLFARVEQLIDEDDN